MERTPMDSKAPLDVIAASLRRHRARAGLSLSEVAKRAGVAKSTLSQLESATGNPSVETLWALAVALDTPFATLLDPPRPKVQIIRAGEGPVLYSENPEYSATLVASSPPYARRDIYRIEVSPGPGRRSDPHNPGVVEHVILGTGRALIGPADEPIELHPGDYISYPGDLPHVFIGLEERTIATLISEHV
ncbi:helix-turn-helix domain-containing protein [Kribbella sp. NPDC056951]|uniref:helix-turn-helix domain-containing protein n=1 Tax=Kribbella sp. NPDC056951 TaxID=3345978 RepID=UPI00362856DF